METICNTCIQFGIALLTNAVVVTSQEPTWGFYSYLNEEITIPCNDSSKMVFSPNYIRWQLPWGGFVDDTMADKFLLNNRSGIINFLLTVKDVQDKDSGVYLCYVYETDEVTEDNMRFLLLRGLNIGGHLHHDLLSQYRQNIMVGGLAALSFFALITTACLVYKFRYRRPRTWIKPDEMSSFFAHGNSGYGTLPNLEYEKRIESSPLDYNKESISNPLYDSSNKFNTKL